MTLSYDHGGTASIALISETDETARQPRYPASGARHPWAAEVDTDSLISSERGALALAGPKPYPLYAKGKGDKFAININDIRQGNYGDCFFLSSIAAVAQHSPKNIENMIVPQHRGGEQGFLVRFHGGTSTFVSQADIVAEVKSNRGAALGDGGECWIKVLEIALRRLSNAMPSFTTDSKGQPRNDINGGLASEALPLLTGRAAADIGPGSLNGAHMQEQLHSGAVITAVSNGDLASTTLTEKYGIAIANDPVTGKKNYWHEYAVTKIDQHGPDGEYYLSLFNPWGIGNAPRPIPMADFKKIFARITIG
jgi:hypothetical protein